MNNKFFFTLTTLLIIAAVGYKAYQHFFPPNSTVASLSSIYPDLVSNPPQKIRIIAEDKQILLTQTEDEYWKLEEPIEFPIEASVLFQFLEDIEQRKKVRLVSNNADDYDELGVQPWEEGKTSAESVWILFDGDVNKGIVFGKLRDAGQNLVGGRYYRLLDQQETYLTDRSLFIPSSQNNWLLKNLLTVDASSVQKVSVTTAKKQWLGERIVDASGSRWQLNNPQPAEQNYEKLAKLLQPLKIDDIFFPDTTQYQPTDITLEYALTSQEKVKITLWKNKNPSESPKWLAAIALQDWQAGAAKMLSPFTDKKLFQLSSNHNQLLDEVEELFQ